MSRQSTIFRLIGVVALLLAGTGHAQPILLGSTGSIGTQPQTTAKIVDINPATGAGSNPRDTGILALAGMAFQPTTGFLFGLTSVNSATTNSLVRLDIQTGAVTLVGSTGLPFIIEGDIAFNPINGMLYGVQDAGVSLNQRNLFRIDPNTGSGTIVGSISSSGDYSALAFDFSGTLFTIDTLSTGNSVMRILDANTASTLSTLTLSGHLGSAAGLAFDPITGAALVSDGGQNSATNMLYSLNTTTGVLSPIGPLGMVGGVSSLTFVTAVAEPNSLTMLACAFLLTSFRFLNAVCDQAGPDRVDNEDFLQFRLRFLQTLDEPS